MRRALLVGINDYTWAPLKGCINDVYHMKEVLEKHHDNTINFHCKTLLSSDKRRVTKHRLMENIKDLFSREAEMVMLYFSGHGIYNGLGGWLVTQDAVKHAEGITINDIITLANKAHNINQVVIILDCCHSGNAGGVPILNDNIALLRRGVSIISASLYDQYAVEKRDTNQGLFTSILVEALKGGASDILGNTTAAGLYEYTEKILGPWDQRPVFKTHSTEMTSIRRCDPVINKTLLSKLTTYFPEQDYIYNLDSSYDPELEPKHKKNEKIMANFRQYLSAGLLIPVGEKYLYHAAKNNKACQLTPLGKFYWKVLKNNKS